MNFREKFVTQAVICLMIFSAARTVGMMNLQFIKEAKMQAEAILQTNYTSDDIKDAVSVLLSEAQNVHEAVTTAVLAANTKDPFAQPLGEKDENGIQIVYAPSGGQIVEAGIDDNIGMYVKIRHDDKISVCGNLSAISVLTDERVKRGDIIGSFDSSSGKEFYYEISNIDNDSKISV